MIRATFTRAVIAAAAFSCVPAIAELPSHLQVATLSPTRAEAGFGCVEFGASDPLSNESDCLELPTFSGFGTAVAIRNGIAFVYDAFPLLPRRGRRGLRSNRYRLGAHRHASRH